MPIIVRSFKPADAAQVSRIFNAGIHDTFGHGFRSLLFSTKNWRLWAGIGALSAAAGYTIPAALMLKQSPKVAIAVSSAVALTSVAGMLKFPSWQANRFINGWASDVKDISKHYMTPGTGNHFFVAEDTENGEILGIVAVERVAQDRLFSDKQVMMRKGDAELKRMSVSAAAQGKGIARKLLDALEKFVREQPKDIYDPETTEIVLVTSTLSEFARTVVYPRLGFKVRFTTEAKFVPVIRGMVITAFHKPIKSDGHAHP